MIKSRVSRPSFNQELEQFLRTLPENVRSILREPEVLFNPTKDMTNLEAHIYQCEEVAQQFHAGLESEITDPLEKLMADEEERIASSGRNMIGWTVRTTRAPITRN